MAGIKTISSIVSRGSRCHKIIRVNTQAGALGAGISTLVVGTGGGGTPTYMTIAKGWRAGVGTSGYGGSEVIIYPCNLT